MITMLLSSIFQKVGIDQRFSWRGGGVKLSNSFLVQGLCEFGPFLLNFSYLRPWIGIDLTLVVVSHRKNILVYICNQTKRFGESGRRSYMQGRAGAGMGGQRGEG